MNILGVGPAELIIIVLLLLVVAGPKRMIQWAYIAGRYWAQIRAQLQEAARVFQNELEQAGIDPEVVKTAQKMTRRGAQNPITQAMETLTKPVADAMKEVGTISLEPPKNAPSHTPRTPTPPAQIAPATQNQEAVPDDHSSERYDAWTPN